MKKSLQKYNTFVPETESLNSFIGNFDKALANYRELGDKNAAIELEKATLYRNIIEKGTTNCGDSCINVATKDSLAIEIFSICKRVIDEKLIDPDDIEDNLEKKVDLTRSQAMIRQADALSIISDIRKIEKRYPDDCLKKFSFNPSLILNNAFEILKKCHINPTAEQWNLRAYIELQNNINSGTKKTIKDAETYVTKALDSNKESGNFYDTFAEILFYKKEYKEFYIQLDLALSHPNEKKGITVEDYRDDKRWENVACLDSFKVIMKKHENDKL